MKSISPVPTLSVVAFVFAVVLAGTASAVEDKVPKEWVSMRNDCIKKVKTQIDMEIHASMTYLSYASYFSRDAVNRPGFAKFFFEAASEERQHAIKLFEYLMMRGKVSDVKIGLLNSYVNEKSVDIKAMSTDDALTRALKLETEVTNSILRVMKACEQSEEDQSNDYHFVDYLTVDFLDEQYKGQRDLAGKLSTLLKMKRTGDGELSEFIFDKKLLNGKIF